MDANKQIQKTQERNRQGIENFVRDMCILDPQELTEKPILLAAYHQYCTIHGYIPRNCVAFSRILFIIQPQIQTERMRTKPTGKAFRFYGGIALKHTHPSA